MSFFKKKLQMLQLAVDYMELLIIKLQYAVYTDMKSCTSSFFFFIYFKMPKYLVVQLSRQKSKLFIMN